jgi:hypothetical protein
MLIISIGHCFYSIKECNQFRIYLTIFSETFNILGYLFIMSKGLKTQKTFGVGEIPG